VVLPEYGELCALQSGRADEGGCTVEVEGWIKRLNM